MTTTNCGGGQNFLIFLHIPSNTGLTTQNHHCPSGV